MIDNIDREILSLLQANARIPNTEIAKQVGMAPSGVLERLRKLENHGIIQGYTTRLNAKELDFGFAAYVFVRTDDMVGETTAAKLLAQIPEVLEVHHIAGEDCFLLKVRAADTSHFANLLRDKIGKIKSVRSTRSTIVLETVKETTTLPLALLENNGEKKKRNE
jgi:Lrp/AsnC family leucine-responsive transcriptional regulator